MNNKYKRQLTARAEQDIASTVNYIAITLSNAKASRDLLKKIRAVVDNICAFPRSCQDCRCFLIENENIRYAIVDNYALIYEISDEEKQINILRFVYAKMDLSNITVK